MSATALRVRKGRKLDQVLDGARDIFLRDGFEGASVDDIARSAGVSKATLYSYFPDKRLLFMEVASRQCSHQAEQTLHHIDMSQPPHVVLRLAALSFMGFILSDMGQRIFRICVAESDRFPELGRQFYESGPMTIHAALVGFIRIAVQRGDLSVTDYDLAADQFAVLCKADLWPKLIFGIRDNFDQDEIERIVDGAIETFMARYGTSA